MMSEVGHGQVSRERRRSSFRSRSLAIAQLTGYVLATVVVPVCDTACACDAISSDAYRDPPEVAVLDLDPGEWHVAQRARSASQAVTHYVRASESLRSFTELVSWEVTFRTTPWTLQATRDDLLTNLRSQCASLEWRSLAQAPGSLTFEWEHEGCYGRRSQTSLVRLVRGVIGTHQLSYSRRGSGISDQERDAWVARLGQVPLESPLSTDDRDPVTRARVQYWMGQDDAAIDSLLPAAAAGRADAQEELAGLYFARWNLPAALRWLSLAAEHDHPKALLHLAEMYESGWGVERADPARALRLFERAAEIGDAEAQSRLGVLLTQADPPDRATARRWLERASAQGDLAAMYQLGQFFERGWTTDRNLARAAEWYGRAARAGFPKAQLALGRLYAEGLGGPPDDAEAIKWLVRAAMQGESAARDLYLAQYGRGPKAGTRDGDR